MNLASNIQDLSIVLAIRNYNPTLLTPDFLIGSGVVSNDWELARQPAVTPRASQIAFTNGVQIEAQPGLVSFTEGLSNRESKDLQIPDLVRRYAASLPNLNYLGIGINPRFIISFDQEAAAERFIQERILSPGSWQEFGTAPMQASVSIIYTLKDCQLRLNINSARLQVGEGTPIPAILFGGNFAYSLSGESPAEHQQSLNRIIDTWTEDVAIYRDLIDNRFLTGIKGDTVPLFPAPIL
jgi:hypothetical protein